MKYISISLNNHFCIIAFGHLHLSHCETNKEIYEGCCEDPSSSVVKIVQIGKCKESSRFCCVQSLSFGTFFEKGVRHRKDLDSYLCIAPVRIWQRARTNNASTVTCCEFIWIFLLAQHFLLISRYTTLCTAGSSMTSIKPTITGNFRQAITF